jgi:hypothetical protein
MIGEAWQETGDDPPSGNQITLLLACVEGLRLASGLKNRPFLSGRARPT